MTDEEKITFIKSLMVELFDISTDIDPSTNFLEIGVDSLQVIDMQLECEERLNLDGSGSFTTIHTVSDLMSMM